VVQVEIVVAVAVGVDVDVAVAPAGCSRAGARCAKELVEAGTGAER